MVRFTEVISHPSFSVIIKYCLSTCSLYNTSIIKGFCPDLIFHYFFCFLKAISNKNNQILCSSFIVAGRQRHYKENLPSMEVEIWSPNCFTQPQISEIQRN